MGQHFLPGNPPVPLILRRSAQARRISLRVSSLDGRVTLTLPRGVSERTAIDFAAEKEAWLRRHLSGLSEETAIVPGALIPVEGRMRRVEAGRRSGLTDEALVLSGSADRFGPRAEAVLKTLARDRLAAACELYSTRLGRRHSRITLRDTRSRWGSCTHEGALMFSWRLIMAPADVLSYVAAHEVAHLARMDHSPAFWAEVERIHGPYSAARNWLRREGGSLHRYRFSG